MEKSISIQTISEYLACVKDCYDHHEGSGALFFRGQADQNWELQPSILRDNRLNEKRLILDYKQVFAVEPDYPERIERILVEMQHHKIPTRLLDWSISPLVALFFACAYESNKWGTVYSLNPWSVYKRPLQKDAPTFHFEIMKECRLLLALGQTTEEIQEHCMRKHGYSLNSSELDMPFPLVGRHMDPRVSSQQGCFVIWGTDYRNLDTFSSYSCNIKVCKIPRKAKAHLLQSLSQLGINSFTIMPDYEGFLKSIQMNGSVYSLYTFN